MDVDRSFAADQLAHLADFSATLGRVGECEHPRMSITVRHDTGLFNDRLERLAALPYRTVIPFRGEPYHLAQIGDVTWWRQPHGAGRCEDHLYARDQGGRIHILLRPGAERGERYLMRVIREAALRCAQERGWAVFHAAAAAVGGRGVLLAGTSGAGKTTVLSALAAYAGADLIAADRAAVDEEATHVLGVPLSVRIGSGTIGALPPAITADRRLAVPDHLGPAGKAALTPAEFAGAFGVAVRESAPLALVVMPQLTADQQPPTARPFDRCTARRQLATACCTPYDEDWLEPWLTPQSTSIDALQQQADQLLDSLADSVPVLHVTAGVQCPDLLHRLADCVLGRLG
ncbi:hypothetical protein E6W39_21890 [Kitasatospora acidiphila]|uniref:Uncharacterized protein n=1 Tax=Kitasatospora acidiphila TaxID=2567942 RepID=A0A540W5V0_9ACTN|nr:hypothetical protein [Kitasatospora acidiphila]TQF04386.1 hypothetical protein E6W39_21890 [Kitasatospora acidiphila]